MPEYNSHNEPFDDIFRRKEDPVDIPFREEDWLELEKKLDAYDAKLLYRRRLGYLLAAAILLISMMGYLTSDVRLDLQNTDTFAEEQVTPDEGPMDSEQHSDSGAMASADTDDQQSETESGESNQVSQTNSAPEVEASNQDKRSSPIAAAGESGGSDRSSSTMNIDRADFFIAMDCRECRSVDPNGNNPLEFSANYDRVVQPILEADKAEALFASSNDDNEKPLGELTSARSSGLSIGMKVAPDLSTVGGLTNFDSPGYSFGFDVAYRINERFAISTGIARSVVRYRAGAGSYETPVYLNEGIVPDQMTGECVLLDIPIGLRVNVVRFSGSRVFATGSLSSYVMLNEAYRFETAAGYGGATGYDYNYNENTGTSHFMSNAGLSIGYEYDLNSNFSIRVEPQIKIPIREVGVTNVRLFSLGSFFSLSYNL